MNGYQLPVEFHSKFKNNVLDEDVITELSVHQKCTREDMKKQILLWEYNVLTATYLLLLKKKKRGEPIRLQMTLDLQPQFIIPRTKSADQGKARTPRPYKKTSSRQPFANNQRSNQYPAPPTDPVSRRAKSLYSDTDDVWETYQAIANVQYNKATHNSRQVESNSTEEEMKENFVMPIPPPNNKKSTNNANRALAFDEKKPCPTTTEATFPVPSSTTPQRRRRRNKTVEKSSNNHDFDRKNIYRKSTDASPLRQMVNPRQNYGRVSIDATASSPTEECFPLSPERKSKSVDDALHTAHFEPLTPSKKKNKMIGSLEKGLDRMKMLLTPTKKHNNIAPRKVKASQNISNIARCDPDELLSQLKRITPNKQLLFKQKGYSLRCHTNDDSGKAVLKFELEICQVNNNYGIRRKRLKGDAFVYKRICESIINEIVAT